MNLELLARLQTGTFAQIILKEELMLSGYIAADPADPSALRFDSMIRNDHGYLQELSLKLTPNDIVNVHFLNDPPEFMDAEGNNVRMPNGFFKHLN